LEPRLLGEKIVRRGGDGEEGSARRVVERELMEKTTLTE
jgi:hypothetical protein